MSKNEQKSLKNYLKTFQPRSFDKAEKMLSLLEKYPEIPQSELVAQLYGDPHNKSFFHLKNSIFEKMLEVLTLNIHLNKNYKIHDDLATFIPVKINKQIIHAFVLHKRGLNESAKALLEECIEEAESWNIPELKLMALIQLRNMSQSKEKVCKEYTEHIITSLRQFETDIMGVGFLDELRVLLPQPANDELISKIEDYTRKLAQRLLKVYSARGQYYYLMLKFVLFEARGESRIHCKHILNQIIDILNRHKGLRSRNRCGVPYMRMSEIELKCFNFDEAYHASLKAMDILPRHRINHIMAGIHCIHACLYMGNFNEAIEKLEDLNWYIQHRPKDLHAGWLTYLQSYAHFMMGNYQEALHYFHQITQFQDSKSDWNPALRIYEIQLYIELEYLEFAEMRIETFRKYLERHHVIPRMEQVYHLLNQWEKYSFSNEYLQQIIQRFRNNDSFLASWKPLNYEILPFEFWLLQKQQDKSTKEGLPLTEDYLLQVVV